MMSFLSSKLVASNPKRGPHLLPHSSQPTLASLLFLNMTSKLLTQTLAPPSPQSLHLEYSSSTRQLGSLPHFLQISAKSHLSGRPSQITLQEVVPSFPTILLFCIASLFIMYICSLALPHSSPKQKLYGNRDCFFCLLYSLHLAQNNARHNKHLLNECAS